MHSGKYFLWVDEITYQYALPFRHDDDKVQDNTVLKTVSFFKRICISMLLFWRDAACFRSLTSDFLFVRLSLLIWSHRLLIEMFNFSNLFTLLYILSFLCLVYLMFVYFISCSYILCFVFIYIYKFTICLIGLYIDLFAK